MKRQYLGDSKDSFKWDYLDFLVGALALPQLKIVWMITPDDDGSDGKTSPERFPARPEVLRFCNPLRTTRNPEKLAELPAITGARYSVAFHNPQEYLARGNHGFYFAGVECGPAKLLFLDPDNGFEPEKSKSNKHVFYTDVDRIIKSISDDSVVAVFQHFRRKRFSDDFARIRERLLSGYACAAYWHSLIFVSLSPSLEKIGRVAKINEQYAKCRPVEAIA